MVCDKSMFEKGGLWEEEKKKGGLWEKGARSSAPLNPQQCTA